MGTFQNRQLVPTNDVSADFEKLNLNNGEVEVDLDDIQGQINTLVLGASNETIGVFSETDAVNTNNYAVTTGVAAYFIGWKINLNVANNNTGNATLNPDGKGSQPIRIEQIDGTFRECQVDEISGTVQVEWDGTQWKLISAKSFDDYNRSVLGGGELINGDFQVWELGESLSNPVLGDFLADRFQMSVISGGTTSGTFTISQQEFDHNDKPVNSRYFMRWNQTVAGDRTDIRGFYQTVEDLPYKIDGKFITYTRWIRSSVAINADLIFRTNFGSGGSADQQDTLGNINYTDLNEWVKFTFTIKVDYTGKTFGDGAYCFILGGSNGFSEINNNICTFDVAEEKIEIGNIATKFISKALAEELRNCQKYTYVPDTPSSGSVIGQGSAISTTVAVITIELPTRMRTIPSISLTASEFRLTDGITSTVCTNIAISANLESKDRITLDCTVAAGLTQYRPYKLVPISINKKMIIDAEL